jgi:hypothetical protein
LGPGFLTQHIGLPCSCLYALTKAVVHPVCDKDKSDQKIIKKNHHAVSLLPFFLSNSLFLPFKNHKAN